MVEFLVSWAEQIIIALIIIIMLEMIIPNSSYIKYVKIILGIFVLYVVFNPLIKNKGTNFNIEQEIQKQTNQINTIKTPTNAINYNNQIESMYKQKFKENITNKLYEKGYEIKKIAMDIRYQDDDIKTNKLELKISKVEKNKNIKINKVKISEEKEEIDNQELEQIKQEISNEYSIDISKIFVESEKFND